MGKSEVRDYRDVSFKDFPPAAKTGIIYVALAWILHFIFLYLVFSIYKDKLTPKDLYLYQQVAIPVVLAYFLYYKKRNYARVLCILCNALIILTHIFLMTVFYYTGQITIVAIAAITAVLFGFGGYYLLLKESADFFKAFTKKEKEPPVPKPFGSENKDKKKK